MDILNILKQTKAFSLVETLMVTFIFVTMAGACFMIVNQGSRAWQINSIKTELQQELRKAKDWIKEDLIQAGSSTISDVQADGAWYSTITFNKSNGVTSGSISWSANTTAFSLNNNNQLIRTTGSQTSTIAEYIESMQFRRQAASPEIVEISLEAQKKAYANQNITLDLDFQIQLRN